MATRPKRITDIIISEFSPDSYCREYVDVEDGETIAVGDLLQDPDSDSEYSKYTSGTVVGIALEAVTTASSSQILALVRGPAVVNKNNLQASTAAVLSDLEDVGIIAR